MTTETNTETTPTDETILAPTNCSFCAKSRDQLFQLVVGPGGIAICNECVAECVKIINQKIDETKLPQLKFHS
jgi:ATP-dependent Clp protease ATP-binding subunit ClpX